MVELIEQAQLAVDEMIDILGRATIEAVLKSARAGSSNSLLPRQKTCGPRIGGCLDWPKRTIRSPRSRGHAFEPRQPFSGLFHTARSSPTAANAGQAETPPVKKAAGKNGTHSKMWMILSRNTEEAIVATTRLRPMTATGISQEPLIPAQRSSRSLSGDHSTH